ncbi:MAG TPA: isoprenylcysteine carboxylmethyltransferase family protein [Thermodesulfobacteriota bacterium]|mgnify:CR=1 FL=1|nr:isoprenylcysteine carboxylmethyltransferase family protein [Thermodesulfobacteriota bacterium]HOC39675.1 isoprenylcysteine carboxylmethyltransferase family protein [Thermodesulfobacteriota bacterium]
MTRISFSRIGGYLFLAAGTVLGPGTVFAFWVFLLLGPLHLFRLDVSEPLALLFNASLSLLFFLQHSILIRPSFRAWAIRFIPLHYYGPLYAVTAGGILLAIMLLWQESNTIIVAFNGPSRWLFHSLYGVALAGFIWCIWALRGVDAFGLNALSAHLSGATPPKSPFIIRGPYRWIRHPVYFFWIVMLWSSPILSADRLLLNLIWSTWLIIATFLEDRDLGITLGSRYDEYRRHVPMLIPHTLFAAWRR